MADEVEILVVAWRGWGIQVMVLLSFTVQVTLLLLADIRRHKDSTVLKFIIWSAYMLADTTALYALGHMSLMSRSPEQQLMALWAPLLLLHLGGQDNITAYAIEDNRLWLRHLQTFGVQVLAAAYVMYVSSILRSQPWLRLAAILMFVTGILKYGERVWALMSASNSASNSLSATSYKDFSNKQRQELESKGHRQLASEGHGGDLLFIAYKMLDVPKQLFEGPTRYVEINMDHRFEGVVMLEVVRMQLLMMYDLLYTKAAVVHTLCGRCIRAITLPAIVAALLLFHGSSDKDVYRKVDVVVTYVLLGGAVVLETTSLLRAIFCRWTYAFLLEKMGKKCQWLSHVVQRRIHHTFRGNMGQHNLFRLCGRSRNSISSKIAKWMGHEDWWDSMFYSWSTSVPQLITGMVVELVSTAETSEFDITNSRGRNVLTRLDRLSEQLGWGMDVAELVWSVELELDESILVWHIATNVFLIRIKEILKDEQRDLVMAIEALSNYMFFLLAARPYMLPYPVSRQRYVQLCYDMMNRDKHTRPENLPGYMKEIWNVLLDRDEEPGIYPLEEISRVNPTLDKGFRLGTSLVNKCEGGVGLDDELMLMAEVWVEMLCYTAYWCNENCHAKHLSSGAEMMTTISLLMLYMSSGAINKRERSPVPDVPVEV